jgi:chitin synthase
MRFVVFLDLLSTVVQPVIVGYIIYLIIEVVQNPKSTATTAFILLGAIYGLQAIIFIVRRKWDMVGWMIIYIIATPVFSFALPLLAFWRMDDFSWGNTRVVTGEKGKQIIVSDEGKFDPASIPKRHWEEYQAELWDQNTQHDDDVRSQVSGISYATRSFHPGAVGATPSEYGGRPSSQLHMQYSSPLAASRQSLAPSYAAGGINATSVDNLLLDHSGVNDGQPSDDAILAEIREILRTSDLMSVTKKSIKAELERRFGVNLDSRRQYIGSATEAILSGQL